MQVVLLAAGKSSRFIPFNGVFAHKSLVPLLGKTILEHTLTSIKKSGITDVVLVVHEEKPFRDVIGEGEALGMHITYAILPEALGMGAALLAAEPYLHDRFFLMNAYHLEFDKFADIMQQAQKNNESLVLLGKKEEELGPYGYMGVQDGVVKFIVEKPLEQLENALRIIGIYLLSKDFVSTLKTIPLEHYHFETALDTYVKSHEVTFVETDQQTITIKYPWDLFTVKDYLLSTLENYISPHAKISPHATIIGNVHIEEGVTVMEGACIKGPVYLGKNAFVGNNAVLRNGVVVEQKGVVGSYIEVKNSIIMDYSTTHTGLLEDSIVGRYCKVAAGILTANVRLDRGNIQSIIKEEKVDTGRKAFGVIMGDHVELGVRVTTMPGIIIGNNCLIGPSTVVMKNLASDMKYYAKFSGIVEDKK